MPNPAFFSSPGTAESFMYPSYTETFVPTPVDGTEPSDWLTLTETDAVVAADAGSVATASAPPASATAETSPTRWAERLLSERCKATSRGWRWAGTGPSRRDQ